MNKKQADPESITEAVRVSYKSGFWKFFLAFLVIITTAVGSYVLWASSNDELAHSEVDGDILDNSFFSSIGDTTKETIGRVFESSDGGDRLVEVVDVDTGESFVSDSVDEEDPIEIEEVSEGESSDYVQGDVDSSPTEPEEPTFALCSFDTSQTSIPNEVIINEVAWMGGASGSGLTSNDEWIELKNVSGGSLDLSGWQVIDELEQIHVVLGGALSSGGFYLMERTDDSSVPLVSADAIYSGALSNTNEGIRLFDSNCNLRDEVFANSDWLAGDASSRRTMQRESDLSWTTFGGSESGGIWGTPGGENGVSLVIEDEDSSLPPVDEEEVVVPPSDDSGKININTAGLEELQEITGVGPAIAQRIIDYRNANGLFQIIEDIINVSGIGSATFEKMKDQITV